MRTTVGALPPICLRVCVRLFFDDGLPTLFHEERRGVAAAAAAGSESRRRAAPKISLNTQEHSGYIFVFA